MSASGRVHRSVRSLLSLQLLDLGAQLLHLRNIHGALPLRRALTSVLAVATHHQPHQLSMAKLGSPLVAK